jgi:hypothetical protein
MYNLPILAIRQRRLLEISYASYSRIVEPYMYGLDRTGSPILLCYQTQCIGLLELEGWQILPMQHAIRIEELSDCFDEVRTITIKITVFRTVFASL